MTRSEWFEWGLMILVIVAFWPLIFWAMPRWYMYAWSAFGVLSMGWVMYRRISRYRADLRDVREMMKRQGRDMPLGSPPVDPPEENSSQQP